ncbi:hypothetical protein RJ641_028814 [Dillenia turbinata]|uniref:Uncharacterized protein n=1 Tax=Dillenia turbinata TaxID=194707 RepID=A0AAN8W3H6_9MAGN
MKDRDILRLLWCRLSRNAKKPRSQNHRRRSRRSTLFIWCSSRTRLRPPQFYVHSPGLVDWLNAILSPQIRIFGYTRVMASFNAKKFCDRRKYVYLIPVFALDPSSHLNR